MSLLVITDDSTREELAEAIGHLRLKQLSLQLEEMRAEVQAEIDALLDAWVKAT